MVSIVEGSPVESILSTISNRASQLALNVVGTLIEDQVGDPTKFEKNLKRVKSAFSGNVIDGMGMGAGDCCLYENKSLLSLPLKARQNIWNYLDDASIKMLRSVCHQLRHEMDYEVGLSVVLQPNSFNNLWIRSISIRTCFIRKMTNLFTLNNVAQPEKLQRHFFDPDVKVDPDMTELIFRKFRNIQQIVIYTEDVVELRGFLEEVNPNGFSSSQMFSRLEDQFRLIAIDVKFDTSKWKMKWNIKLMPENYEKYYNVQNVMGPFGVSGIAPVPVSHDLSKKTLKSATISIPFVQDRDRFTWLKVLQSQDILQSLTCDLNATHLQDYGKVIRASCRTLEKLLLLNISCSPKCHSHTAPKDEVETPFDWKMFEHCQLLKEITLIAETFMHSSVTRFSSSQDLAHSPTRRRYINTIHLTTLQCPQLRAVWLENLNQEEFQFLKEVTPDQPRFEMCTLKNCKAGDDIISEAHLGLKKERNRSLECLCFGTTFYDDDDLENFEKYTAEKLEQEETLAKQKNHRFPVEVDNIDLIECFQLAGRNHAQAKNNDLEALISNNMNLLGGIAFTAWLYFC